MENLSQEQITEKAIIYSALMLHDDEIKVTSEKIQNVLKSANIQFESYMVDMYVRFFENNEIGNLISSGGSVGTVTTETVTADKEEEKEPEPEPEPESESESDDDMFGGGLFD
ncbi:60S ACIDIC ribosomal protein P1 [Anaeramoeba flamelloides]|uniref:60S ACIDIC ribosomal protein P1 n=1 Tax=Anaeramoeba flamelloides TaxID=1746091 RepID=A0ABQ8ZEJ1_9EUKA|nr:60S ACIDIC ribosomal protein P1 [Anaeramoeba flamelloides]